MRNDKFEEKINKADINLDKNVIIGAEEGDENKMFLLANYYYKLNEYSLAYFWMEKAANKKCVKAIYGLACFYLNGVGTKIEETKAVELLFKAAKLNYPDAIVTLTGIIISRKIHEKTAFKLAKRSAEINRQVGEYYLGMCCLLGFGTKRDTEKARVHFAFSAALGSSVARFELKNREFALAI